MDTRIEHDLRALDGRPDIIRRAAVNNTRKQAFSPWIFVVVVVCVWTVDGAFAREPPITDVAFAPDGKSVVAVSQAGMHEFSWPALERERTMETTAVNLHSLAFSPDGKHVAVGGGFPSEQGSVEIFSWPAGQSESTIVGHEDSVLSVAWRDRTHLLTASIDREIRSWDIQQENNSVRIYRGHSRAVAAICLLPDNSTLVSAGADQSLRVWDLELAQLVRSLNQHTATVNALALRPAMDGLPMIASASGDRTIRFWQPTIGRMVRYVRLEVEPLAIAWLNDGVFIVAACVDGGIRVIDADNVKVARVVPVINGWAYAVAVHPSDGSVVVGGSDGQLRRVILNSADR